MFLPSGFGHFIDPLDLSIPVGADDIIKPAAEPLIPVVIGMLEQVKRFMVISFTDRRNLFGLFHGNGFPEFQCRFDITVGQLGILIN